MHSHLSYNQRCRQDAFTWLKSKVRAAAFMLILTELEDSLWGRAVVINIVLPKEGHRISVVTSASLIQMLNPWAVV